jgi:hypothetical protein
VNPTAREIPITMPQSTFRGGSFRLLGLILTLPRKAVTISVDQSEASTVSCWKRDRLLLGFRSRWTTRFRWAFVLCAQ